MFDLIDKLNHIQYEELDIDEILDQRESHPFDTEWMRVYKDIKELKKGKKFDETTDIEEKHIPRFTKNRTMMSWRDIFVMILG